ncbi:MAG TPA: metalloregulator ArsR/SmtB family transcription factor [Acidobacteriaceae bacterium]|nr:metalloregulator ArsR/SmtB family transcription factor [Acidobacteriaceae bacterium]
MARREKKFDLARLFAALADTTRLRLLNLMRGREVCVCYFVEILQQSQPKISRHLAYLRNAGVVSARREGKWMHYRIEMPKDGSAAAILDEVMQALERDPELRADIARLNRACCQPARFVALEGAPLPVNVEVAG